MNSLEGFYVDRFEALRPELLLADQPFDTLREAAIAAFASQGVPTRKHEQWKYTDVTRLIQEEFEPFARPVANGRPLEMRDEWTVPGLDAERLVLVDGYLDRTLSTVGTLPDGVVVSSLADALSNPTVRETIVAHLGRYARIENEPFTALNAAFFRDGAFVYVPQGVSLERPVHVIHITHAASGRIVQPRHLFVFESESQGVILESYFTDGPLAALTNVVTEFYVGARARVDHYRKQNEDESSAQITQTNAYQEHSSYFSTLALTLNGRLIRNNIHVHPDAEFCETHLCGLFLMRGDQHVDNHTFVDHAKPHCFSNELYKGILDDRASSAFSGMLLVRPNAQKTNAFQENKTILLTDEASSYAKPQLEIYADDVKCSHGATTGAVDQEALFYLRARGIPEDRARNMLLFAFVHDVLERIEVEPLRDQVLHVLNERLQ